MWSRPDSQEVGLEAATLERVRNSSLVEWFRADNSPGLKSSTEAADIVKFRVLRSRSEEVIRSELATRNSELDGVVGERRGSGEVVLEGTVERPRVRMPA